MTSSILRRRAVNIRMGRLDFEVSNFVPPEERLESHFAGQVAIASWKIQRSMSLLPMELHTFRAHGKMPALWNCTFQASEPGDVSQN